jgi:hypothetical protein
LGGQLGADDIMQKWRNQSPLYADLVVIMDSTLKVKKNRGTYQTEKIKAFRVFLSRGCPTTCLDDLPTKLKKSSQTDHFIPTLKMKKAGGPTTLCQLYAAD